MPFLAAAAAAAVWDGAAGALGFGAAGAAEPLTARVAGFTGARLGAPLPAAAARVEGREGPLAAGGGAMVVDVCCGWYEMTVCVEILMFCADAASFRYVITINGHV